MQETKIAILGYGGIARAHMNGYNILKKKGAPIRVVALCDADDTQFEKDIKINVDTGAQEEEKSWRTYTDLDEMLAKEEIDTVDICVPTYLHKEYTVRLLRAGKNVQCEKPMALTAADCAEMIATARECSKHLMVGQCLRFCGHYLALKAELDSGKHGKVMTARFERLSPLPTWGFDNWFVDFARSGGEMLDMSIHDYDMARFLFGEPEKVSAVTCDREIHEQTSNGRLYYKDGLIVTVDGSWAESKTFPFSCPFRVVCEKATIAWNGCDKVRVYPNEGEAYDLDYENEDYMAEEALFFAKVTQGEVKNEKNPPESAMQTVALIEKLKESAACGGAILGY
ncbi:MAG: Gfo/Idh/MocA family oxidoreductase [Clostridia bacterium]|nr:Gfo/Idh/MocA family oxidoreductase [Clostridia bacterium]